MERYNTGILKDMLVQDGEEGGWMLEQMLELLDERLLGSECHYSSL